MTITEGRLGEASMAQNRDSCTEPNVMAGTSVAIAESIPAQNATVTYVY